MTQDGVSDDPVPGRRAGRAPAMSRDDRRAAIALATVPLLEEHGSQVSTRQIALAAGVAEGTLFRAFDDKVELLAAAAERALDPTTGVAEIADLPAAPDLAAELAQVARALGERGRRVRRVMIAVHTILASDEGRRAAAVRGARGADVLGHRPPERSPVHGPGARDARVRALGEVRAAVVARLEAYRHELRIEPERLAHLLIAAVMGQGPPVLADDDAVPVDELVDVLLHGATRA